MPSRKNTFASACVCVIRCLRAFISNLLAASSVVLCEGAFGSSWWWRDGGDTDLHLSCMLLMYFHSCLALFSFMKMPPGAIKWHSPTNKKKHKPNRRTRHATEQRHNIHYETWATRRLTAHNYAAHLMCLRACVYVFFSNFICIGLQCFFGANSRERYLTLQMLDALARRGALCALSISFFIIADNDTQTHHGMFLNIYL